VLAQLLQNYPDDVRLVYRFFPNPEHRNAQLAAYAAQSAGLQGKFFEVGEALYAHQGKWVDLPADQAETWMLDQAASLGVDKEKMKADMATDAVHQAVETSFNIAMNASLPGTPYVMINGVPLVENLDISVLSGWVEFYKLKDRLYASCPPMVIDPKKQYEATLKTEKGDIQVKLLPDKAPLAVNNFVFLALDGWYNNTTFHRVLKNYIAQGGDPSGSGMGSPGYLFDNENKNAFFNKGGYLAMANSGLNTNGSQFFITMNPSANLNGLYTIFGEVTAGMDVVNKLSLRDPRSTGEPLPLGDKLISVEIRTP
jgi:cyclophilin family peptidyl-prolyl cis-trans isomerase